MSAYALRQYNSTPRGANLKRDSLVKKLETLIHGFPPEKVTLGQIRDHIGQEGLLLLTAFLTLIFLVPVSIPGISTVFGGAILLVGISRVLNRTLWLPRRFQERAIPTEKLRLSLNKGLVWLHRLERISRPHRLSSLTRNRLLHLCHDLGIVLAAGLLMLPFGFVPFSNSLPSLALLLLTIGLLQRDGLYLLLGHAATVATILYFASLVTGGGATINALLRQM